MIYDTCVFALISVIPSSDNSYTFVAIVPELVVPKLKVDDGLMNGYDIYGF